MKITLHHPAFTGVPSECVEFSTREEFESLPYVRKFLSEGFEIEYAVDGLCGRYVTLIARRGVFWYVLVDSVDDGNGEFEGFVRENYVEWKGVD